MSYDFDYFVIGAGSGGIASARRAASYGANVGIAEYAPLGGTCVNRGCVPKKLLVYASRFPEQFKAATGYGWSPPQSELDWSSLVTAVNNEVKRLNGIYQRMLDNAEVELFRHRATFIDPHTLALGDRTITAEKILIAVGGEPTKPAIPGIEHTLTSDDMFTLPEQPKRFLILGGGYIGVEFAGILNGLGSEVTVVIRRDKVLRGFDDDIRDMIQGAMEEQGINIIAGNAPQRIEKTTDGLLVHLEDANTDEVVFTDAIALAALGRKPNIENLGLDAAGVAVEKGAIAVDDYSHTSQSHIFAVGDCTARINLTPVAINEGRALADTEFGNHPRQMSYENIPSAVFSTPEAATVGLTETEAREKIGDAVKIYRSKFRPMYYTLPDLPEKTLMKLVVDGNTDRILGAHMVGEHAAEIIQGVAIALKMGATKANFDATIGIHPSSAEEFVTMR